MKISLSNLQKATIHYLKGRHYSSKKINVQIKVRIFEIKVKYFALNFFPQPSGALEFAYLLPNNKICFSMKSNE